MTVVLPISHVDADLARVLAGWLEEIDEDSYLDKTIVVFVSQRAEPVFDDVKDSLRKVFGRVEKVVQKVEVEKGWPISPNAMFREVAYYINGHPEFSQQPWYFFEPDNTPTRRGWLNEFVEEYNNSGKSFMGCVHATLYKNNDTGEIVETWPHMVGTGVYPGDFVRRSLLMRYPCDTPFDVYLQGEVIPDAHDITGLLQHNWGTHSYSNNKGRIVCKAKALPNYFAKYVKQKAAVVHGCKDSSLIKVLRQQSARKEELEATLI
jgi:hypothetical protein